MMQQPPNEKHCEETQKTQPITGKMPSVAFFGIDIPTFDQVMKHAGFVSNSTHTHTHTHTHKYPKDVRLFRYIIRARTKSKHISRVLNIVLHLGVFNNTRAALLELLITLIN